MTLKGLVVGGLIFLILFIIYQICFAEDTPVSDVSGFNLSLKQVFLVNWDDPDFKLNNLSTFEVARTRPVDSWGKWNALWEGWTLDAGFAYDAQNINTGAILIGREFGTLGKYLPIDFPMKDLFTVTLYPIGLAANDMFDKPKLRVCSGGAYVKFTLKTD